MLASGRHFACVGLPELSRDVIAAISSEPTLHTVTASVRFAYNAWKIHVRVTVKRIAIARVVRTAVHTTIRNHSTERSKHISDFHHTHWPLPVSAMELDKSRFQLYLHSAIFVPTFYDPRETAVPTLLATRRTRAFRDASSRRRCS